MAAFATASELASWLQRDVDTATATLALNLASAEIRKEVGGWSISQESNVVATLDGTGKRSLWLRSLLVTAVASVVEDGTALTVVTGFDWTSYGRLLRVGGCWTTKPRSVVVTYTHGYATVPDDVKGVCLAAAGRAYANPDGVRQETVGSVSVTYNTPLYRTGVTLTDAEKESLGAYQLAAVE